MARMIVGSRWISIQLSILLVMTVKLEGIFAVRPESVLLDVLTKPFVPTGRASADCLRDGAIYLKELERYVPWALQMYDASAKISPGIITGNYQQLGNYDECLRIKNAHGFVGQACTATVQFDIAKSHGENHVADMGDLLLNMALASNSTKWTDGKSILYEWMWCIPSSCTNVDLQEALEVAFEPLEQEDRVDLVVQVSQQACHTLQTDRRVLDVADWIYISILVVFAIIITASTTYDIVQRKKMNALNPRDGRHTLLTSFSLYTNGKNLLKTKRHGNSIDCLDGLRYISICWIIYGHTHYNEVVGLNADLTYIPRMHDDWSNMLVLNGNVVTDTFFLLSGTLLAYITMSKNKQNSNKSLNLVNLYIHRYLRLTPAYAMMIGFYATLFYKLGSGPHWDTWVGINRDYCRENWWTNLLYVNNYINVPRMCMSQSWYLATDMQLIWLSPIFLYPMVKFSRSLFFWLIFGVGLTLSILSPLLVTFFDHLTGTMLYYKEQLDVAKVYLQIYTRVYNRAGPYIIGLGLGYLLSNRRSFNLKIPMSYIITAWMVASVAGLSVVFGPIRMYEYSYNRIEASFYAGFHRHVFALSVSWIIFASAYGYAGPIGKLLSWTGWMPLSKLTYSAYLCHFIFLLADSGSGRNPKNLTRVSVIHVFFGNLVLTMLLSAIWSLCFEMPFLVLERALNSRRKGCMNLKHGQSKTFGSTDTEKTICRSTDTLSTESQNFSEIIDPVKLSRDSVYNSHGTINYCVEVEDERNLQDRKREDGQTPSYIYVIDAPNYYNDSVISSGMDESKMQSTFTNGRMDLPAGLENIRSAEYINNGIPRSQVTPDAEKFHSPRCANDKYVKSKQKLLDGDQRTVGPSTISAVKDLNECSRMARGESERPTSTYGSIGPDKGTATLLPEASFADRSILIAPRRSAHKLQGGDEKNQANAAFRINPAYSNDTDNSRAALESCTTVPNDFNVGASSNDNSGNTVLRVSVYEPKDGTELRGDSINKKLANKSGSKISPYNNSDQQNTIGNNTCVKRKESVVKASDHNFNRKLE